MAGNEVLFELVRQAPATRDSLFAVKGFPRGMSDARAAGAVEAIARGNAVPEADLPRFPKSARWDRDPDFDERVAKLKAFRDRMATDLDMDPGVLCSRDRMEAAARRNPRHADELLEVPELRRWQVEVLGQGFVRALANGTAPAPQPDTSPESPYKLDG